MPQLDITTFSSQLFWLGLFFVILYLILTYAALPKIVCIYEGRQKKVEENLARANTYRKEAEELLADYEAILAKSRIQAREHFHRITQGVMVEVHLKQQKCLEDIHARLQLEEQKLSQEYQDIRQDLPSAALEVATLLLQKITGRADGFNDLSKQEAP